MATSYLALILQTLESQGVLLAENYYNYYAIVANNTLWGNQPTQHQLLSRQAAMLDATMP